MKYLFCTTLLLGSLLQAADPLPLAIGNEWTLKSANGQSLHIRVGTNLLSKDDETYYSIAGYRERNSWVRQDAGGELQWLNLETEAPELLTRFDAERGTYATKLGGCLQTAAVDRKRVQWRQFNAIRIEYFGGCPDNAIGEELYVENLGLVRRVVTTFTGPVTYDLVAAKVGNLIYTQQSGAFFDVSLPSDRLKSERGEVRTRVALRLSTRGSEPIRLLFSSGQQYEFKLINAAGEVVWQWSKERVFVPALSVEQVVDRRWESEIFIEGVTPGVYTFEGSLTNSGPYRFVASTTVRID